MKQEMKVSKISVANISKGNNPSSHIGHRPYGREMKGKRDYITPARFSLS
jgi:hypothetical protein